MYKRQKEHIHLLRTAQNLGYGQGNNVGAAYAFGQLRADYVWVLNNDTRLDKDAFSELYAYITRHPDAEIIGQTVLDYGTSSVQALGGAKYNPILGVGKRIGVGQSIDAPLPPPPAVEKQLDYLAGASFVISRALYEKVGLFAPEFFLYFEEIDLAKRVKGTGADLRWAPGVKIEHKEGASISPGRRSALSEYHATLSSLIATRKHYPFLLPLTLVVRALYKLPRYALSRRWDLLRAHFGGIGKFLERYL